MTSRSKVQVLLSSFNGEKYIAEQLDSILIQEGIDVSILVRDDGSRDRTVDIVEQYCERYPETVTLLKADNRKLPASFLELIRLSEDANDYFAFCDQDDIWQQGKLERAVSMLRSRNRELPLLYCSSTTLVDQSLNYLGIGPSVPLRELTLYNALLENIAVGCTSVFNDRAMKLVKMRLPSHYDRIIMHDWWLYLIVTAFGEVLFDKEPFILYRQHEGSTVGGSVNAIGRWSKRLRKYSGGNMNNIFSKQALQFLQSYEGELSSEHQEEIRRFTDSQRRGLFARLSYAFKSPLYRQSFLDNAIYKLILLSGKA